MKKEGIFIIAFLLLIVTIFLIRLINPIELDDVTPGIPCEDALIQKADTLWVIPDFENNSIAYNEKWCAEILSSNKTIGMHGITHSYKEFGNDITYEELHNGMEIFKSCFGFYPTKFKPPQLTISEENENLIKEEGMQIMMGGNQLAHKVYHCNDSDIIKNWIIGIF